MPIGYRWVAPINRLLPIFILLTACVQGAPAAEWDSPLYTEHALVGKIWHAESAQFVSEEVFWQDVANARYLILGEKHDNPDHHSLQLSVVQQLVSNGALSKLTLEMLDSTSDEALENLFSQEFSSNEQLRDYVGWDAEGWNWNFYGPIVASAFENQIPISAGNISGETVGRVYGQPTPPEIEAVFDDEVMSRLTQDIDESHCGLLPESQFAAMVRVQQTRDYTMAEKLRSETTEGLALLIAGNYHARQDLGVPNYLLAQDNALSRADILSLSFMEVQPGEENPSDYQDKFSAQAAYDYIWFTPAVTAEDYCDSLR